MSTNEKKTASMQEINWELINEIELGYDYIIHSNQNKHMMAGGSDVNNDDNVQIYYRNNSHTDEWEALPTPPPHIVTTDNIFISHQSALYICDFAMGLFRTTNFSQDWTELGELLNEGCSAFNIQSNGVWFAGLTYTGIGFIHRSSDQGNSWQGMALPDYQSNYPVEHIEFDSLDNIYLGTINGIYKSTDQGDSWEAMNVGLNGDHISSLYIDEKDHLYVYTTYSATTDGLYISTDHANSWQNIAIPEDYVVDLVAKGNSIIIIDGYNTIQLSNDLGNNWHVIDSGLNDNSLHHLHLDPDGYIYAGGRSIHQTSQPICHFADINNDDLINILDVVQIVNFILNTTEPSLMQNCSADLNSDHNIDILDVVNTVNIILESNNTVVDFF